jgi:hypothetical protein
VDSQFSQDVANINRYRVEVSGWDATDAYFVEKTTLDWSGGDDKEISLRPAMREGAVLFVRLLQQFGTADSLPIAYRAAGVRIAENGRSIVQLDRLHPRAPFKEAIEAAEDSQSKVA